jgi:hypothetical protein
MYHCISMGKIQIQTLTRGYKNCLISDVFQNIMLKIVQDMEYVKTYLDDLLTLTNSSFKDHLLKLEMVRARSFDLENENNHGNLEQLGDNPFD